HIFGGSGLVSMLSHEVREERGLSYSVGSSFVPMQTKGPFSISLQTRNDQADEALDVVRNTLARFMEKGPTDEQMEAAINNIGGSFPLGISSNSGLVAYLGVMGFYGLPLDYLELYVPRIVAETRETVHEAFRSHLDQDKFLTVIVGGGQPKSADVSQSGTVSEANR
ncbi:MAG: M16 family metallopeptidase, partial [Gammaproteobacteria bacterium]